MERLNHHHLYIFWIFCRTLSFTKTALTLNVAQSAITSQIQQLEDFLNKSLVDRSNSKRPLLTEEGQKVLEYAESIFNMSQELLQWARQISDTQKKVIKIGAVSGMSRHFQFEFIQPLLDRPDVVLEITAGDQKNLLARLQDHSLDVVLSSHNVNPENKGSFHSHVLAKTHLVFVQKTASTNKRGQKIREIFAQNSIFIPGKNFESKPELEAFLERFPPQQILGEIDDTALLRTLAVRSGKIVAMPETGIASEIKNKEVVVIKRLESVERRFYAITRQRREPNLEVRELIDRMKSNW
ncbi:MAG: LysR family transcriptional regulator [Bdellovibrionia bacterium]